MNHKPDDSVIEQARKLADYMVKASERFRVLANGNDLSTDSVHEIAALMMVICKRCTAAMPDWVLSRIGLKRIPVEPWPEEQSKQKETHDTKKTDKNEDDSQSDDSCFSM